MNIFFLDKDPRECARQHCDKHVVKMVIETAQLLSTAHRLLDGKEWIDKTKDWTEAEFEKNYRKQRSFETLRDWEQGTLGEAASMNFNDPIDPVSYDSYKLTGSLQSTAAVRENKIKTLENEILDLENKIVAAQGTGAQKNRSLLFDKNWESITLQKHFEQAANQGQTKVRIPTEETAVKIQGYQKENQYVTPEGGIDFENMDPATQMDSFEDWMGGETIYDYRKGHKTVLAKYKKIPGNTIRAKPFL